MAIRIAAINSNKDMSAREKNIAIRKAKKLIKQRSKDQQDSVFTSSKRFVKVHILQSVATGYF